MFQLLKDLWSWSGQLLCTRRMHSSWKEEQKWLLQMHFRLCKKSKWQLCSIRCFTSWDNSNNAANHEHDAVHPTPRHFDKPHSYPAARADFERHGHCCARSRAEWRVLVQMVSGQLSARSAARHRRGKQWENAKAQPPITGQLHLPNHRQLSVVFRWIARKSNSSSS